jgi:hypothetical protein
MPRRIVANQNVSRAARVWFKNYTGKDPVRAYRKHFHVTRACAILELSALGLECPAEEVLAAKAGQVLSKQVVKARKLRKRQQKERENPKPVWGVDYDDTFAFIVDFTSGGAPFRRDVGRDEDGRNF